MSKRHVFGPGGEFSQPRQRRRSRLGTDNAVIGVEAAAKIDP
jgi:hypothetical protein